MIKRIVLLILFNYSLLPLSHCERFTDDIRINTKPAFPTGSSDAGLSPYDLEYFTEYDENHYDDVYYIQQANAHSAPLTNPSVSLINKIYLSTYYQYDENKYYTYCM